MELCIFAKVYNGLFFKKRNNKQADHWSSFQFNGNRRATAEGAFRGRHSFTAETCQWKMNVTSPSSACLTSQVTRMFDISLLGMTLGRLCLGVETRSSRCVLSGWRSSYCDRLAQWLQSPCRSWWRKGFCPLHLILATTRELVRSWAEYYKLHFSLPLTTFATTCLFCLNNRWVFFSYWHHYIMFSRHLEIYFIVCDWDVLTQRLWRFLAKGGVELSKRSEQWGYYS